MFRSVFMLFLGLAVAAPLTFAAPDAEQRAALEERVSETIARLALSDDQIAEAQPIITACMERQRAVLERYGIDLDAAAAGGAGRRPSRRQALQIKREMDSVRGDTRTQLAHILTAEQLAEYDEIQEARRLEMRERLLGGR